jgi:mevalonate kinase
MKGGKRKSVNKVNKKRINIIMDILEELDLIAQKYKETITKEKIKELAETMTDLPIGDMEVSILWSKLNDFQNKVDGYKAEREGTEEAGDNIS